MLTIYKASAGSGKTYTLVLEYIKLLLGVRLEDGRYVLNHRRYLGGMPENRRSHSRVLAITFTNKATAEMKDRIIRDLDALSRTPAKGSKDSSYAPTLTRIFGCTRDELREVAARSLRSLLNDYSRFNVSTIDAFFQTILRSFAREIDRQGDYRLELDERTVISQAISLLFDEVNNDAGAVECRAVAGWLNDMARDRMCEGRDFNPFNRSGGMYSDLVSSLLQAFSEEFTSRRLEMDEYLSDPSRATRLKIWLRKRIDGIKAAEAAEAAAMLKMIGDAPATNNLLNFIKDIVANRCLSEKKFPAVADGTSQYLANLARRCPDKLFKAKYIPPESLLAALFDWYARLRSGAMKRHVYGEMLAKTDTLLALAYIYRYIDRYRRENNLIVIADTNSLLGAIISESDTPFIYERVGVELENFLIDEFQDTSRLQWRNLRPLLANSLSAENDNLIIGDVKQSIYRWRGGDSHLLGSEVADSDFPDCHRVRGELPGENTNYRSAHLLVKFNNSLFRIMADMCGVEGYEGVAQTPGPKMAGVPGMVRVYDLQGDKAATTAARVLSPEGMQAIAGEDGIPNAKEAAYRILGESIMDQHRRGYRFDEIAILCRTHNNASDIAEALQHAFPEIPLVSEEALKLRSSRAVKLIVSILEIIDKSFLGDGKDTGPEPRYIGREVPALPDPVEEARARRYDGRRRRAMLIDSFNYYMAHGKEVDEALRLAVARAKADPGATTADGHNDLANDLARIRALAPSNLCALVEAIIDIKISPDERNEELPYIMAFVDLVEQFARDYVPSIHSFLNYWHENMHKLSISSGEKQNAVTISTVHKAKGLEWPCVHIPAIDWKLEADDETGWFEMDGFDEIPDEMRPPLMYLTPVQGFTADDCPLCTQTVVRRKEKTADYLNVAYVAFTRAVRELHVSLVRPAKAGPALRVADAVVAAMSRDSATTDDIMHTPLSRHTDDSGNYAEGEPTRPVRDDNEDSDSYDCYDAIDFTVSFNKLNMPLTRLSDLTMPDDNEDDPDVGNNVEREIVDRPENAIMEAAARHGLILHSILAQMYTLDDLDHAIEYHRRDIPARELEVYRREITDAFGRAGDNARRWFSPDAVRVLNEQSIYNTRSNTNHRADRIVWNADGSVDVIDYKFTSAVRKSHYEQVRGYASMIKSMGYREVRAFLWYPILGEIISVADL